MVQTRKKRSLIWKIPRSQLAESVSNNITFSGILRFFDIYPYGNNQKNLQKRLDIENIDYSHIEKGINSSKGKKPLKEKAIKLELVLVENSTYSRHNLKRRLLFKGLLSNECYECGMLPIWNNKPLSLQIDHINGIKNDNRLSNLRMVCPNCHSQTPTFSGKNIKKLKK